MRLTLVISSLQCGGAERVMAIMANYWAARGHVITLLTLDGAKSPFYELDCRVQHQALGVAGPSLNLVRGLSSNLKRIGALRRALRASHSDAVISFADKTNVLVLLASRGLKVPVIVSEHTDPALSPIDRVWHQLRQRVYPMADLIVVLTQEAK